MTPDDPRHGTNAGAIQHWRDNEPVCQPCLNGKLRTRKGNDLKRLAGKPPLVPLGNRAHHILTTIPHTQLAKQTGIRRDKLSRYRSFHPDRLVQRATRDRILAGRIEWTPIGIQRRLRALSALGWSMAAISKETGIDLDGLKGLRRRPRLVFVRTRVAEAVVAGYQRLHMTPAPIGRGSVRVAADAARHGWAPPLAFDDIDDPNETPDGWAYQPLTKNSASEHRLEVMREIAERGGSISDVSTYFKLSALALEKWCDRAGERPLFNTLNRREHVPTEYRNQYNRPGDAA